jgi:hypothetical protein
MPIHRFTPSFTSGPSRLVPAAMGIAGVALTAAALVPAATARAHTAAAGTTTCAGSQTVAYSPGLSMRAREITLHGTTTLSRCVSSADPSITGGRSTFKATGRLSCTSGEYSGTRKITWNNGRTSTMSFRSVVSVSAGASVVAIKGEVTDGEFSGQKWGATFTMFTTRPTSCATPEGLPTTSGPLALTIGSLVPGRPAPDRSRPSPR